MGRFGRIDYAINNAATAAPLVPTGETTIEDFERIQKNQFKKYLALREGRIEVYGEASAVGDSQWQGSYQGFIDTPLVTPAIRMLLAPQIEKTPMGRLANPQEVAEAVVYLLSDRASYVTGSVLSVSSIHTTPKPKLIQRQVDGGYSAQ
ncbi:uncharacterized protein A1O5_11586 [Cladophialophora psammophila CBS 110553]|uniref:3-oxoacyl-[acyl-carrier protein] reductase n=1 Tax=Cladophialophora psammophila CBS 110553 TaxID=1182543 RepID=W9WE32_9EURO|nr:uncharacterized protein A1O5_11586 [Cladophialophora psammophila CBS 110553]EXJ63265.1 hypothetical protein A1O5_11586 [Cladophialophora psammophila CBS 110553]